MGVCPLPPPRGRAPRHSAFFARAQKQSPRAAAPVHKRRRRGFRLLLHPVGHRCAPRPCIKPNLPHGLKRVASGRSEAPTGVFSRGMAGHHTAAGPQYPPRRKYARGGLWWGHMGVFAGRRTPCRDPNAPRYLAGSWIRAPPAACRPHAARGALISSAAASGGRMPERARHMPLFGALGLWRGRCRRVVRPRPERGQRARWGRSSGKP